MFAYEELEKKLVTQMENTLKDWSKENDDIYIFALDLARGVDSVGVIANTNHYLEEQAAPDSRDYWFYKYCEDEWELFDTFGEISGELRKYIGDNNAAFTNPETYEYTEAFDEHCEKVIESCKNALICFAQSARAEYPKMLFTFNIREYLDGDERIEIFEKVNDAEAAAEYTEHIDEFA
ncbi:MAG: DUF4303 domain-containing protein [Acetatifactor sp.]|nr:DUF4303 domain-containing protein [Acetatifactor sp.]